MTKYIIYDKEVATRIFESWQTKEQTLVKNIAKTLGGSGSIEIPCHVLGRVEGEVTNGNKG